MTGPRFVDNREGNTFQKSITGHLEALRKAGESPEELCIATGYFNAAGWLKVAEEADREWYTDIPQHKDGMLSPFPDRPGLGLELDPHAIEKWAV